VASSEHLELTMSDESDDRLYRDALEALPEAIAVFDAEDRFVLWNDKFREVYGAVVRLRRGVRFEDHLRACVAHGMVPAAVGREDDWVRERLARFEAADGAHEHRLADDRCVRVQDRRLANGGRIGIRADVTALADRERDALALLNANPAPVLVCDTDTRAVIWVNEAAVRFYGHQRSTFLTLRIDDFRVEQDPGEIAALIPQAGTPEFDSAPRLHRTASGERKIVKVTASRLSFEGRQAMVVAVTDVTDLHRMQEEVRQARNFLRQVIDQVPTAVFAKDMADEGRFVIFNKASEALFGIPSAEALGATDAAVFGAEEAGRFAVQDRVALRLGAVETVEDETIGRPDGGTRHVRTRKVALDDGARPRFIVGVSEDVTDRRASEACIAHMAHHDALTDLPNRFLFRDRLSSALARLTGPRDLAAVHCIDFDGFKAVNDAWGHATGDRLLQSVSARLRAALRSCDTAARFGGDEFVILQAPIADAGEAAALAARLVTALGAPHAVDGRDLDVSASVGVALAHSREDGANNLIERADEALYRAKREGRNTFRFAEASDPDGQGAALKALAARMRAREAEGRDHLVAERRDVPS
jgi:diguanylate cyclase (GGDEF)-like protein/PAS domain S-box-containing protein